MFIINITYKVSLEIIDSYIEEHRDFLNRGYTENIFLASGPKKPRIGGIILAQSHTIQELENFIMNDPFIKYDLVTYEIIEFLATKTNQELKYLLKERE